jgi:hypothetical protein
MKIFDLQLFDFMTQNIHDDCVKLCKHLAGMNEVIFREYIYKIKACRQSGEMPTSLFNGFANFCLLYFLNVVTSKYKKNTGLSLKSINDFTFDIDVKDLFEFELPCVVEGDDGLSLFRERIDETLFEECGFNVKLEHRENVAESKFCGIVSDEIRLQNVADPIKHLVNLGWVGSKYVGAKTAKKKMLMRSKAFSILAQYPNCPVLLPMALYVLRLTHHLHKATIDLVRKNQKGYQKLDLLKFMVEHANKYDYVVAAENRIIVQTHFGLEIIDQIKIEKYFNECKVWQPIPLDLIESHLPPDWLYFSEYYVLMSSAVQKKIWFNISQSDTSGKLPKRFSTPFYYERGSIHAVKNVKLVYN